MPTMKPSACKTRYETANVWKPGSGNRPGSLGSNSLPHHKITGSSSRERGTAGSGALKANALPGGARRLAVRAVKAACFLRSSERSGRALTEEADGPGAGFQQEGQRGK